jgi:hypothetical protein
MCCLCCVVNKVHNEENYVPIEELRKKERMNSGYSDSDDNSSSDGDGNQSRSKDTKVSSGTDDSSKKKPPAYNKELKMLLEANILPVKEYIKPVSSLNKPNVSSDSKTFSTQQNSNRSISQSASTPSNNNNTSNKNKNSNTSNDLPPNKKAKISSSPATKETYKDIVVKSSIAGGSSSGSNQKNALKFNSSLSGATKINTAPTSNKPAVVNQHDKAKFSKPIEQRSLKTGSVIKVFPSAVDAATTIGCTVNSLLFAARGVTKSAAGYAWRFTSNKV